MFKVYFVDDEEWLINELQNIVDWQGLGFEVCGYNTDPFDAQEEILILKPTLVICDIYMDGISGLQLAKNVHAQNPKIEFCFLSAYDKFEYAVTALKLGAVDYLTKPLKTTELYSVLEKVKKRKNAQPLESPSTLNMKNANISEDTPSRNAIVNQIVKDIQANMSEEQSLSLYAKKYGYNASYLSSLFKKEMNKSFVEYVISYRIEKAKELVLTTDKQIQEIAVVVGYKEYFHFSKVFKQHVGVSPTEYRKIFRKRE